MVAVAGAGLEPPPDELTERGDEFTGRGWALDAVDAWLESPRRALLLTGTAGTGKSTIAARIVQMGRGHASTDGRRHLGPGTPVYAHFCRARDDRTLDPLRFVEALSQHLALRLPSYAEALLAVSDAEIQIEGRATADQAEAGAMVAGVVINSLKLGNMSARLAFERVVRRPLEAAAHDVTPLLVVVEVSTRRSPTATTTSLSSWRARVTTPGSSRSPFGCC